MDLAYRARVAEVKQRGNGNTAKTNEIPDAEYDDNDERDSYELSFEDERDIVETEYNGNGDADDDDEEADDVQGPAEWQTMTATTTTTSTKVIVDRYSGDQQTETIQQVSYLSKLNANANHTIAAISSEIDPGAAGDSLSAIYGNTDDENVADENDDDDDDDDDDDADETRMAQPADGVVSAGGSTTDVSVDTTTITVDHSDGQAGKQLMERVDSVNQRKADKVRNLIENAAHPNAYSTDDQQSNYSHRGDNEEEKEDQDEFNEYSDLKFLQSSDDEQPDATARTAARVQPGQQANTLQSAITMKSASAVVCSLVTANITADRLLHNKAGVVRRQIDDASSSSSDDESPTNIGSSFDHAKAFSEIETNESAGNITTPTNFSAMMRRRTAAAAEAEQTQKLQSYRFSTGETGVFDNKILQRKLSTSSEQQNLRSYNEQNPHQNFSADDEGVNGDQNKEQNCLSKKTSSTRCTPASTSAASAKQSNMNKPESSANTQLSPLSPDTRMFARHEQNSFSAADEGATEEEERATDDDIMSDASTTTIPSGPKPSRISASAATELNAASLKEVSLTPKNSVQQQLQNIGESDCDVEEKPGVTQPQAAAIPLHAVKSRRINRPGAVDSAPDLSSHNNSRTTTSSSRRSGDVTRTQSKHSSSIEEVVAADGSDLYKQFKRLQNQYKSLQTRIQSGIKQHLQQTPGMSEELDDLEVYNRGLHDKREHERAQRLTLLEKLKVELGKSTSAVDRLRQTPHDTRTKDAVKTALSSFAQQLGDAREVYRSLDLTLNDQAKTSVNDLKQCQERLGTYAKRISADVAKHELQQRQNNTAKSKGSSDKLDKNKKKPSTGIVSRRTQESDIASLAPYTTAATGAATIHTKSAAPIHPKSFNVGKTHAQPARTSVTDVTYEHRASRFDSNKKGSKNEASKHVGSKTDVSAQNSSAAKSSTNKSRVQTRLAKGDLPDAVFEYRNFLEHNGGRNGVGWTELEHKGYLSARTKHRAFAPTHTGGDGDVEADGTSVDVNAMPINDERFYSDLAKELMIKTAQQVREHDEWYAQVQRLDAAQKQAVKAQKDAKRLEREQKQKQIKEQQARQRLMAQKLREQAMKKWHEQTKQQVDQWRAHKTVQQKQKEDEQKFQQLVKKEHQTKMRHKHDQIKQKVLEYRQQREQQVAADRDLQQQQELEERRQRALQANKFLKLSANKSIQDVQQHRQQVKTVKEQRRVEKEERLQKLRSKVSVNVERDPQRLLEQTTAWKRRTAAGAAAAVDKKVPTAQNKNLNKQKKTATHRSTNNGSGDAAEEDDDESSAASDSESSASSSTSSADSSSENEENEKEKGKSQQTLKTAHNVPSATQLRQRNAAPLQKSTKSQHVVSLQPALQSQKMKQKPFVAGGLVKKTVVMTRTTTVKIAQN